MSFKEKMNMNRIPAAIGPYSAYRRKGSLLISSGQLPIDPETNEFSGSDIASQTRQSLENIKAILDANNASMDDVLKTTVYLKTMADFTEMNAVYATYFNEPYPARTAFQVGELPKDARVEIEVTEWIE